MQDPINTLSEVRNNIIDTALIYGSIFSALIYLLSLVEFFNTGFEVSFITDFLVVVTILIITLKRKYLNIKIKSYIVLVCIFIVVVVDVIEIGVLSANKVLLILIPFFSVISLSIRKSIILFTNTVALICFIAFLHIKGVLSPIPANTLGFSAWAINLLLISLVTIVILLIVSKFNKTHLELINDLTERNRALKSSKRELAIYRGELEELVEERTSELNETYKHLQNKTKSLENTVLRLNETKEELVQAEKMAALGSLASGVAHEINNPLNFISGGVEILEDYASNHFNADHLKSLKPMLDAIKEGVKRSASIVESLNQYSGSYEHVEDNNINSILVNCVNLLEKQNSPEIKIETALNAKGNIRVSKGDLYQLCFNILNNAVEAITASGTIKIESTNSDSHITVEIGDNGQGIPEKHLSQLTDPFFSTKGVGKGIGLGLYIASKILKKLNGNIKFESKAGEGTVVTMSIPIATG